MYKMSLENLVISESKEDVSKTSGIITKQHGSHHERDLNGQRSDNLNIRKSNNGNRLKSIKYIKILEFIIHTHTQLLKVATELIHHFERREIKGESKPCHL